MFITEIRGSSFHPVRPSVRSFRVALPPLNVVVCGFGQKVPIVLRARGAHSDIGTPLGPVIGLGPICVAASPGSGIRAISMHELARRAALGNVA